MTTSSGLYGYGPGYLESLRRLLHIVAKALPRSHPNPESAGARLRRLRVTRGLTQDELGKKLGLSQRMIAYYESQGGTPSTPLLAKLAKALHVSTDEIVGVKRGTIASADLPQTSQQIRLWRRLRLLDRLAPTDRRSIIRQIEALAREAGVPVDDQDDSD